MVKKKQIAGLLSACILLCGCAAQPEETAEEPQKYTNLSADAGFDTVFQQTEYGYDREAMAARFDESAAMFSRYDGLFDIYNDHEGVNGLKAVNDNAGNSPVTVDPEVIDMLMTARYFYDISGGSFDITIGSLLKVWHEYRDRGIVLNSEGKYAPVPKRDELEKAAAHSGWDSIVIDEENCTVFITDPEMSLDAGGIAKGYAAEQIGGFMERENALCAVVNAGRNIRTVSSKPDGQPWNVGIVNPADGGTFCIISMEGSGSFVTSGDYERYYIGEDENRYHHIVDPHTLYPAAMYHSVSVITPDSCAADCLSTALFTLSIEDGKKVLERYRKDSGNEAEAVWIMDTDRTQNEAGRTVNGLYAVYTGGLEGRITWQQ